MKTSETEWTNQLMCNFHVPTLMYGWLHFQEASWCLLMYSFMPWFLWHHFDSIGFEHSIGSEQASRLHPMVALAVIT